MYNINEEIVVVVVSSDALQPVYMVAWGIPVGLFVERITVGVQIAFIICFRVVHVSSVSS